jgi:CRP-like cAMP-binding protein
MATLVKVQHARENRRDARTNRLLAALPLAEYRRLRRDLEPVILRRGQVLVEAPAPITHLYFPTGSVVLLGVLVDGVRMPCAVAGAEGVVGLSGVLGAGDGPEVAVCVVPGTALRLAVATAREAIGASSVLHDRLLRSTHALLAQVTVSLACEHRHRTMQRYARWLLLFHDRVGADHIPLTQGQLAAVLGAHRGRLSATARPLLRDAVIRHQHGKVIILDRQRLEAAACSCYAAIQNAYDRLLAKSPRAAVTAGFSRPPRG